MLERPRLPRPAFVMRSARLVLGLQAHRAFDSAAAVAFWFFLSLVPLLVLLGFLVGLVARVRGVDTLLAPVLDVVPEAAQDVVRIEVERLAGSTATLAPLGVVGFLWTASSGLHSLMDTFEATVRARRRPWWKQRAMALGWVLAGLATACFLAWALVTIDGAIHAPVAAGPLQVDSSGGGLPPPPLDAAAGARMSRARGLLLARVHAALSAPLEQAIGSGLLLVVGFLLLAGFYRFAVERHPDVRPRVWPGAITAVASWLVVSWAFGFYVVSMASYALYYGGLAAVAVMLVWLYLTSLSLTLGAEVNAQLETRARRHARSSGAPAKR